MSNLGPHDIDLPDGWSVVRQIGQGGQATAIHVKHEDGRDGVFRKIKRPMSEVNKDRFQRELEILSRKVEHEGIVTLWDWSSSGERPWYITELGGSFEEWWEQRKIELQSDPEVLVDEAIDAVRQVASALAECHDNGIVHRDLKPANLVMKNGVASPWPILIDFGLAHDDSEDRLTPANDAVGNARFSPDIMRRRVAEVLPWLDVFYLAQILIWMLDEEPPKAHWRRPVRWEYAVYHPAIALSKEQSLKAFTASCSNQMSGPANAQEALDLLDRLFPSQSVSPGTSIDVSAIVEARRQGEAKRLLIDATLNQEMQSSAPLAEGIYGQLRGAVLAVIQEVAEYDPTAHVVFDHPFQYRLVGATDLMQVSVGPFHRNIQLRIKVKIVPENETPTSNERNRAFWRRHIPEDAICFTFALEGGIPKAGNSRYTDCRWVTIRRDGALYLHPLDGDLGTNYGDNDLGGSATGAGVLCSIQDIEAYVASVFTSPLFWEFIAAAG